MDWQWIGCRGAIEWPPRSSDLTPVDLFLWGFIKDKVFAGKPHTVQDMIQFIIEACQEIDDDEDFCLRVCMSVSSRLQQWMNADSKPFEYLGLGFLVHVLLIAYLSNIHLFSNKYST